MGKNTDWEKSQTLFLYCTAFSWLRVCEAIERINLKADSSDDCLQKFHRRSHALIRFLFSYRAEYEHSEAVRRLLRLHNEKELYDTVCKLDMPTGSALAMVEDSLTDVNLFVSGEKTGREVVFSMRGLKRWNDLFKQSILTRWNSNATLWLLQNIVDRPLEKQRWLELGAGVGGNSMDLIDFAVSHDCLDSFCFTDISETFFSSFRRKIKKHHLNHEAQIEYAQLDINHLSNTGRWDMVFATNVIHNARDIILCLNDIKEKLMDSGGTLIISETLRSPEYRNIFLELIYLFLDEYASLPDHASKHERGLYSDEEWMEIIYESKLNFISKKQFHPWNAAYYLK